MNMVYEALSYNGSKVICKTVINVHCLTEVALKKLKLTSVYLRALLLVLCFLFHT
jgi:hypothetical protein